MNLVNCPYCGTQASLHNEGSVFCPGFYWVECGDCNTSGPNHREESAACRFWNRLHGESYYSNEFEAMLYRSKQPIKFLDE